MNKVRLNKTPRTHYPSHLKIGAHSYELITETPKALPPEVFGQLDRKKNQLVIDGSMPPDQIGATLLHEALHAINNELNHTLLDSLAEQLYQFLADT